MSNLTPGTTVRILVRAGAMQTAHANLFVEAVEPGTEAVYDCPHPTLPGWHLVMVDHPDYERVLYVPLHVDQMEALD